MYYSVCVMCGVCCDVGDCLKAVHIIDKSAMLWYIIDVLPASSYKVFA